MVSNIEKPSTNRKRGIILYVKEEYTVRERELPNSFQEAVLIDLFLPTDKTVQLCLIYRSPNSPLENNLGLLDLMAEISDSTSHNLIILGDFNLPKLNWTSMKAAVNSYEEQFLECVMDNYLQQHITETRKGFLRKNIVAVSFFQNCAIHQYS